MPSTAMNLRQPPLAFALLAAVAALPVQACEFDGLSHGYGPNEALFAGAHRYQALNGFADDLSDRAGVASLDPSPIAKPPPRPSFASWASRKARVAAGAAEAPARWMAPAAARAGASADPPAGPPQQAEPEQHERAQRPPGGGSVP